GEGRDIGDEVEAEPDMRRADAACDMIDMAEDQLGRGVACRSEIGADAGDADHAASPRTGGDLIVADIAVVREDRVRVRMREYERSGGDLHRLHRGAIAAMRAVDQHAD